MGSSDGAKLIEGASDTVGLGVGLGRRVNRFFHFLNFLKNFSRLGVLLLLLLFPLLLLLLLLLLEYEGYA